MINRVNARCVGIFCIHSSKAMFNCRTTSPVQSPLMKPKNTFLLFTGYCSMELKSIAVFSQLDLTHQSFSGKSNNLAKLNKLVKSSDFRGKVTRLLEIGLVVSSIPILIVHFKGKIKVIAWVNESKCLNWLGNRSLFLASRYATSQTGAKDVIECQQRPESTFP